MIIYIQPDIVACAVNPANFDDCYKNPTSQLKKA